jgi:hypothetical protein
MGVGLAERGPPTMGRAASGVRGARRGTGEDCGAGIPTIRKNSFTKKVGWRNFCRLTFPKSAP